MLLESFIRILVIKGVELHVTPRLSTQVRPVVVAIMLLEAVFSVVNAGAPDSVLIESGALAGHAGENQVLCKGNEMKREAVSLFVQLLA